MVCSFLRYLVLCGYFFFFFFKQKAAYEMRISDWSSDVCSSDLEDVENAFSALVEREAQEQALSQGEVSLARARAASLAAYQGGVVSLVEVLDADNRLLMTRDAQAQARTEAARAAVASFRALGGGWEPQSL